MGLKEHKKSAPKRVKVGIITVSTTRSLKDDKSGQWMNKRAGKEGHEVIFHQVVPDDMETIRQTVIDVIQTHEPDALLLTGGTGIGRKDVTIEAIQPMFEKELTATPDTRSKSTVGVDEAADEHRSAGTKTGGAESQNPDE